MGWTGFGPHGAHFTGMFACCIWHARTYPGTAPSKWDTSWYGLAPTPRPAPMEIHPESKSGEKSSMTRTRTSPKLDMEANW